MIVNGVDLTPVIKIYVAGLDKKITEIKNYIEKNDKEAIINFGHKLKGSGKSYGFAELSDIGKKIQDLRDNFALEKLNEYVNDFENIVNKLQKEN